MGPGSHSRLRCYSFTLRVDNALKVHSPCPAPNSVGSKSCIGHDVTKKPSLHGDRSSARLTRDAITSLGSHESSYFSSPASFAVRRSMSSPGTCRQHARRPRSARVVTATPPMTREGPGLTLGVRPRPSVSTPGLSKCWKIKFNGDGFPDPHFETFFIKTKERKYVLCCLLNKKLC